MSSGKSTYTWFDYCCGYCKEDYRSLEIKDSAPKERACKNCGNLSFLIEPEQKNTAHFNIIERPDGSSGRKNMYQYKYKK